MVAECRTAVARLIRAESADRIAFHANTSDAINVIASGVPWKPGDRILLADVEFPANVYPYLNLKSLGVEIEFISPAGGKMTPDLIASKISQHTRLLALSGVQFLSGYRADLRTIGSLCRSNGVIFAVDGIQAGGGGPSRRPENVHRRAFCRRPEVADGPARNGISLPDRRTPVTDPPEKPGWLSVENPWEFNDHEQPLASSARRYEGGSLNMPGLWGMREAIGTLMEFGPDGIESHILAITSVLIERLETIDGVTLITPPAAHERAGIVTIALDGRLNAQTVFDKLRTRGVTIAIREGKLRYSPHFYNSTGDMERAAEATAEVLREERG